MNYYIRNNKFRLSFQEVPFTIYYDISPKSTHLSFQKLSVHNCTTKYTLSSYKASFYDNVSYEHHLKRVILRLRPNFHVLSSLTRFSPSKRNIFRELITYGDLRLTTLRLFIENIRNVKKKLLFTFRRGAFLLPLQELFLHLTNGRFIPAVNRDYTYTCGTKRSV